MGIVLRPGEVPDGCVQLQFHGKVGLSGKWFQRPIPLQFGNVNERDGVQVDENGVGVFTEEEWAYFQKACPGAFTLYNSPDPMPAPPKAEVLPKGNVVDITPEPSADGEVDDISDGFVEMTYTPLSEDVPESKPKAKGRKR